MVIIGGGWLGETEEGKGGINGEGRRLDLHDKHTDDVLQNCTPETYIIYHPM